MRDAPGGHLPQRVVGRYALYGEIASGGMATVHFGRLLGPVGFSRTVAIKRLHPQFAKDPEFVSMFLDEARVAARIQHPNVVATLDVVALQGELFLVMEYLQGESLARILKLARGSSEPVPPRIVGTIATNVLFGLHAAHEAKSERGEPLGIVHRDVSPQNVLVGTDGVSRVLDFGVAKAAGRIQVTREGQVKGKLAYMPPEQLAGGEIDRRADVYAAAVVIWESLTNRRLFDGDNQSIVLAQVLTADVPKPSELAPGLPAGVDEVVLRGLARNPDHRYASAHDMAVALEDTLGIETPRRVGEYLHRSAHEAIAAKAAQVKEIEAVDTDTAVQLMMRQSETEASASLLSSGSLGRGSAGQLPMPVRDPSSTSSPSSLQALGTGDVSGLSKVSSVSLSLHGGRPNNRSRNAAVALAGACAVGVLGGVVWWMASTSSAPVAGAASRASASSDGQSPAIATAPSVDAAAAPAPSSSTVPAAPPSASTASASSSAAASASGKTALHAGKGPGPKAPGGPAALPPPKSPATNCDPPYTVDSTGKRKLKPQCL